MPFCPQCGEQSLSGAGYCSNCGTVVRAPRIKTGKTKRASRKAQRDARQNDQTADPTGDPKVKKVNRRSFIIKAAAKGLVKSLAVSAVVLGPGIALLIDGQMIMGMIWLFIGSFGMMAWTYRKPWRLGKISCLIPPLSVAICYLFQLILFAKALPPGRLIMGAIFIGVLVGFFRGRSHQVYKEKGELFAQRTSGYLVVWVVAYGITQLLGMATTSVWAVQGGLVTGAFSTAMLVVVSLSLLIRYSSNKKSNTSSLPITFFLFIITPLFISVYPIAAYAAPEHDRIAEKIINSEFKKNILPYLGCTFKKSYSGDYKCEILGTESGSYANARLYYRPDSRNALNYHKKVDSNYLTSNATLSDIPKTELGGLAYEIAKTTQEEGNEVASGYVGSYTLYVAYDHWIIRITFSQLYMPKAYLKIPAMRSIAFSVASRIITRLKNLPTVNIKSASDSASKASLPAKKTQPEKTSQTTKSKIPAKATIRKRDPPNLAGTAPSPSVKKAPNVASTTPGRSADKPPGVINADPIHEDIVNSEHAEQAAVAIAMVLIGAGVTVSVTQSIAQAIAQAVQAGVEFTSDEIGNAVADESGWETSTESSEQVPDPPPEPSRTAYPEVDTETDESSTTPPKTESFMGGIWRRISGGASSVASEVEEAGKDLWKNPWLAVDAAKGAGNELWETAVAAGQGASKIFQAASELEEHLKKEALQALKDTSKDPGIVWDTVGGTVGDIRDGLGKAAEGISNTVAAANQAAEDIYDNPELIGDTLLGVDEDLSAAGKAIKETITDPDKVVDGIKTLTGLENLENAMDPDRSLVNRVGQYAVGVMNVYGTATGAQSVAQGLKQGATKMMGRLGAEVATLADDGAVLAARNAGKLASSAGDDAANAVARVAGKSDDAAAGAANIAEKVDDAGDAINVAGIIDDAPGTPGTDSAKKSYADYLENRGKRADSTLRPGDPGDLTPAEGVVPDTSGYTSASEKHIQMVADKHGAKVYTRPTNSYAKELLEKGEALPKPELLKNKSISEIDTLIGAKTNEIGKVGHFEPTLPTQGDMSDDAFKAVRKRFDQRDLEFKNQAAWLKKHSDQVRIDGNLVVDIKTGKPFTGDVDGFTIRGMHNETLPKAVVVQIQNDLKFGPSNVQHGFHAEWDYSELSRAAQADGAQSKFQIAQNIDQKIRGGHAAVTPDGNVGEALVAYTAKEGLGAPNPTASYWTGGTNNPLVRDAATASPAAQASTGNIVRSRWAPVVPVGSGDEAQKET